MNFSRASSVANRRYLVTGATSGIGLATSIILSQLGAKVVLVGRDQTRLDKAMKNLSGTGHQAEVLDLTDCGSIPARVRSIANAHGRLDGLVHSAGIHQTAPLRTIQPNDLSEVFAVNVITGFMLAKGIRQKQVRGTSVSIVLLSSAVGLVGQPGVSAYSASKGAVIAATKSLALELARESIRVNCVCPGVVMTPMTEVLRTTIGQTAFDVVEAAHPLGLGTAEDVGNAIVFLLSDDASWVTGTALSVDGGYTAS